jgi:hypothetical protein
MKYSIVKYYGEYNIRISRKVDIDVKISKMPESYQKKFWVTPIVHWKPGLHSICPV